jgi:hypothetical protein
MGGLAGLLLGAAACNGAASASTPGAVRAAESTMSKSGTRPPMWRVMLSARAGVSPAEVDQFLTSEVLPALTTSSRVGNASTFVSADATYSVQLEVYSWGDPGANLATEIFSASGGASEAERLQSLFSKYFDVRSASLQYYRPDLSLARGILGKVRQ